MTMTTARSPAGSNAVESRNDLFTLDDLGAAIPRGLSSIRLVAIEQMPPTALRIALVFSLFGLNCVTDEPKSVAQWDYVDSESGVYFTLPPGWIFGPAEEFVRRLSEGMPAKAHFYAVRKATLQFNYQDAVLVFSGPPLAAGEPKLSLRDACIRLSRGTPLIGESESARAGVFSGKQKLCAIEPNPEHGLEGELYLLMGRGGILFVMTFAPTLPAKSQVQEALNRLTVLE